MEFIAVLIAVALLQGWGSGGPVQRDEWFHGLRGWLGGWFDGAPRQLLLIVVPTVALVMIKESLDDRGYGLAELVLLVIVLLYSMGRGDLTDAIARYLERWRRGDFQAAFEQLRVDAVRGLPDDAVSNPQTLHRFVRSRVYYRSYERLFAVLFWFALGGAAGAFAYRLTVLDREAQREGEAALPILYWLDWIPARLTALSFALIGNFDACYREWRRLFGYSKLPAVDLLERCGNAALDIGDPAIGEEETTEQLIERGSRQVEAVELLQRRTLVVWVVAIAVIVLLT
jgi:membrane protein required for beta-lactamase induction